MKKFKIQGTLGEHEQIFRGRIRRFSQVAIGHFNRWDSSGFLKV
jgi:hypothetical protein